MTSLTRKLYGAVAGIALFVGIASQAEAGAVYPLYKQELLKGTTNTALLTTGAPIKCQLVTSSYTYSATHQFLSDVSAGLIGSAVALTSLTYVNGKFSSASVTFTAVTTGSTAVGDVCFTDTGTASTSRLVVNNTGFSVVTNGGDITLNPDATNGWFTL